MIQEDATAHLLIFCPLVASYDNYGKRGSRVIQNRRYTVLQYPMGKINTLITFCIHCCNSNNISIGCYDRKYFGKSGEVYQADILAVRIKHWLPELDVFPIILPVPIDGRRWPRCWSRFITNFSVVRTLDLNVHVGKIIVSVRDLDINDNFYSYDSIILEPLECFHDWPIPTKGLYDSRVHFDRTLFSTEYLKPNIRSIWVHLLQ